MYNIIFAEPHFNGLIDLQFIRYVAFVIFWENFEKSHIVCPCSEIFELMLQLAMKRILNCLWIREDFKKN